MIARLLGTALTVALGGLAAGALLLFSNLDRALVLDLYLVFVGAVALHSLARVTGAAVRPAGASAFEDALRRGSDGAERPERLVRLQGLVSLSTATAGDFHHGLRTPLREAAAHALSTRHGIDLDADARRAEEVLGAEAWALLGSEMQAPDRFAPGPSPAAISRTVAAIERIVA